MNERTDNTHAAMDTAIILTANIQKLADFYGQGLELGQAQESGPDHLGFPLTNAYLGFDLVESPPDPSDVLSLWFRVDDLAATFGRFEQLGAEIKYPPTKKPWGDELAALYDPDGNLFGLAQRTEQFK